MIVEKFPELAKLPIDQKRALVEELCDEIHSHDSETPDPAVVEILESRWQAHLKDSSGALTLEEFRRRIGKSEA